MGESESNVPKPLHSYVLLRSEGRMKSAGGIDLPETATKDYAIVVATGPGEWGPDGKRQEVQVKVGDRIMLDAPAGVVGSFWWAGKKYQAVRECFVSMVLPGDEAAPQPDEASRIVTAGPLPPARLLI
jgi:Co-chaperonin GroES (HSP10)